MPYYQVYCGKYKKYNNIFYYTDIVYISERYYSFEIAMEDFLSAEIFAKEGEFNTVEIYYFEPYNIVNNRLLLGFYNT